MRTDLDIRDPEERWHAGLDPLRPSPQVLRVIDGVEVRQRPAVWLAANTWAAPMIDRFRVGAEREVTARVYEERSHLEIEALLTMAQAHARTRATIDEELRRAAQPRAE